MDPAKPSVPPNFMIIGDVDDVTARGIYILGHDKFSVVDDIHITNAFQRDLTSYDDFLLGVLTVLLIPIFSEIAYSIILRSRNKSVPISRILSAILISEMAHVKNVFRRSRTAVRLLNPSNLHRDQSHPHENDPRVQPYRSLTASIFVLLVTIILFTADVLAVVFTQQRQQHSTAEQYNVRAYQPSIAIDGLSSYVRRLTDERPCSSPFMISNSTQIRNYQILACNKVKFGGTRNPGLDLAEDVSIKSLFHRGGSDHKITFGSGFITISIRAQIIIDRSSGGSRRLLFTLLEDTKFSKVRYLHELTIHEAKLWICWRGRTIYLDWCSKHLNVSTASSMDPISERVFLWRNGTKSVFANATGVISKFNAIDFLNATEAFGLGVKSLISVGFVKEVQGRGKYERFMNGKFETGLPNLLSENRRVASVPSLSIFLLIFLLILLALRYLLNPISFNDIVLQHIDKHLTLQTLTRQAQQEADPSNIDNQTNLYSVIGTGTSMDYIDYGRKGHIRLEVPIANNQDSFDR